MAASGALGDDKRRSMYTPSILFNGRFTTRPASGVDRVAGELFRALRSLMQERGNLAASLSIALPASMGLHPEAALDLPDLETIPTRRGHLRGQIWEQLELPLVDRASWLLSPCNLGPVTRRKQLLVIHDAQPLVVPEAYSAPFRMLYAVLQPRIARRAAIVVTVSDHSRKQLEKFGVVSAGRTHVIHNGADHILRIREDPATLGKYGLIPQGYILAIGSVAPHKNLAMLVHAAAARRSGTPTLVIAGGGQPRVFADAGISGQTDCRIIGRVADAELKALYRNAVALAFPSRAEGFGLPPLEAMHCGCPVVASTAGAVTEVCGSAALYAEPNDPGAWRLALEQIASDKALRAGLIASGLERAKRFTWRAAADNYAALMTGSEHLT